MLVAAIAIMTDTKVGGAARVTCVVSMASLCFVPCEDETKGNKQEGRSVQEGEMITAYLQARVLHPS